MRRWLPYLGGVALGALAGAIKLFGPSVIGALT